MVENKAGEARHLLDEVNVLRSRARTDRHAFQFPLLFFGGLTLTIALLQMIYYKLRWLGGDLAHLLPLGLIDMVWLAGLVAGTGLSVWWYHRHGHRAGIQTAARNPMAMWALAATMPLMSLLPLFRSDTFGLLVIGFGLIVLARAERSRYLWIITGLYTAVVVPAVVNSGYKMEILFSRLFGLFGVEISSGLIHAYSGSLLLPALILLVGGLSARRKTSP